MLAFLRQHLCKAATFWDLHDPFMCGVEFVPDAAAKWRRQANSSSAQGWNPRDVDSKSALWQGLLAGESLNPDLPACLQPYGCGFPCLSVSHAALLMICPYSALSLPCLNSLCFRCHSDICNDMSLLTFQKIALCLRQLCDCLFCLCWHTQIHVILNEFVSEQDCKEGDR